MNKRPKTLMAAALLMAWQIFTPVVLILLMLPLGFSDGIDWPNLAIFALFHGLMFSALVAVWRGQTWGRWLFAAGYAVPLGWTAFTLGISENLAYAAIMYFTANGLLWSPPAQRFFHRS